MFRMLSFGIFVASEAIQSSLVSIASRSLNVLQPDCKHLT